MPRPSAATLRKRAEEQREELEVALDLEPSNALVPLEDKAPAEAGGEELIFCEACELSRPADDFLLFASELDPQAPSPQVCDHCRRFGKPPRDPCQGLPANWRRVLEVLATDGSVRRAATAGEMNETTVRAMLDGRENTLVRGAMRELMRDAGLDGAWLVRILKEAGDSMRYLWNAASREFDEFPDHGPRLQAARHFVRIMGLEEPKEVAGAGQGRVQVFVQTNLGDGNKEEPDGTIVVNPPGQIGR